MRPKAVPGANFPGFPGGARRALNRWRRRRLSTFRCPLARHGSERAGRGCVRRRAGASQPSSLAPPAAGPAVDAQCAPSCPRWRACGYSRATGGDEPARAISSHSQREPAEPSAQRASLGWVLRSYPIHP